MSTIEADVGGLRGGLTKLEAQLQKLIAAQAPAEGEDKFRPFLEVNVEHLLLAHLSQSFVSAARTSFTELEQLLKETTGGYQVQNNGSALLSRHVGIAAVFCGGFKDTGGGILCSLGKFRGQLRGILRS
jgi:hypothetical protein